MAKKDKPITSTTDSATLSHRCTASPVRCPFLSRIIGPFAFPLTSDRRDWPKSKLVYQKRPDPKRDSSPGTLGNSLQIVQFTGGLRTETRKPCLEVAYKLDTLLMDTARQTNTGRPFMQKRSPNGNFVASIRIRYFFFL